LATAETLGETPSGGGAAPATAPADLEVVPPSRYRLAEEIGRGGLGRVIEAYDRRLDRTVAIKELLEVDEARKARFVREALVTARLQHPSIVPIYEAGRWPSGAPFYAMKRISGRSLREVIEEAKTPAARQALLPKVIAVADAVAYAHSRRVIHRDLKPANVLLGPFGEVQVIDWGVAKDLNDRTPDDAGGAYDAVSHDLTILGSVLGTPQYMPPEQARGEAVDERADVYALGAMLYHVLAGVPPYADLAGPSGARAVLAEVLRRPPAPPETLEPGLPPDLVHVVAKAMRRDARDRYPTAKELAEDLKLFETGQLVSARAYSAWALVSRWLRRHRWPVGLTVAALSLAIAFGVAGLGRIIEARRSAKAAQALAEQRAAEVVTQNHQLILGQAGMLRERDPTAALAWLKQLPADARGWADARGIAIDAVGRGFARHVWRADGNYLKVRFSPDSRFLATSWLDRRIRVFDFATGATRMLELDQSAQDISFSAAGDLVATSDDATVTLFPAACLRGEPAARPRVVARGLAEGGASYVAFAPDGGHVAFVNDQATSVALIPVSGGAAAEHLETVSGARDLIYSPDGRFLAVASIDKTLRVWDANRKRQVLASNDITSRMAFAPDGEHLFGAELGGIREWTLATGKSRILTLPKDRYISVAVTADGRTLAAGGFGGPVYLLDLPTGQVTTLAGHRGMIEYLAFSPDGKLVASTGMDRTVRVWQLPDRKGTVVVEAADTSWSGPVFTADGKGLVAGDSMGAIHVLSLDGGAERRLTGHTQSVIDLALAPEGGVLASQSSDETVRLWDLAAGTSRVVLHTAPWVSFGRLRFSPDGKYLAASQDLDTLAVLSTAGGERVCTLTNGSFNLAHDFAPDGRSIAFTSNQEVRLAELPGCAQTVLYAHDPGHSLFTLEFARDGRRLASASDDGTVGLYDVGAGQARRLRGSGLEVYTVAFAPDGRWLASGGADRAVRLWDANTGAARILRGHELLVYGVRFSPDGRVVASIGPDDTIRLWDVESGAGSVLLGHRDRILGMAFSPDGKRLATASKDGTVRIWPTDALGDVPVDAAGLKDWLERITTTRIDPEGQATSP
jgi:WD40 repeat protein